ncbi:hypothetical protein CKM354_001250200 [Cercospora kikuchii]|uniref:INO80 complex subunit B-like conserved region domain-containing protein n=1 Tax=Cercospora kikuchii TaxID=84275 RepID=A0A9P3FM48_9PEZI|nr:uncharacterized protein CKM354_001250200 [Cercospora kikuchii]GIZ49472.1 hypothetical protein CKM354_001250200 [Cercospora kikuchii]
MPPARRSARTVSNPVTAARDSTEPYSRTNARVVSSSASIARPAAGKTSLRLTVKAPPSKLRQATSGSAIPPNPYADNQSESDATPAPPRRAARATRNPRTVVDHDSDEMDEDQDAEGEDEEEDAEASNDQDAMGNDDSEEDAEGEDDDVDMDDHPPPPVITRHPAPSKGKSQTIVSAPPAGTLKSVEAKEMEDDDDEELSELDSQEDDELEGNDEEDEEEDDEDESDEDDENSRSATPDLSKLTKRQRGQFVESEGTETNELMALSNEALKKKHLTAEEHVQRRAEMARRRKNLSEKRNEEEKMDTINKLLHKQAPKRRTRAEMEAARAAEAGETPAAERDANALDPTYVRWVSRKEGSVVCVPKDWQESPVGEQFGFSSNGGGRMVEEVQ